MIIIFLFVFELYYYSQALQAGLISNFYYRTIADVQTVHLISLIHRYASQTSLYYQQHYRHDHHLSDAEQI
jgi:hypothetical protein